MATTTVSEQLRLRLDASKYAEPGQSLAVRISGSAREALEYEKVVLRLFALEGVPGRHGARVEEVQRLELVVEERDITLTKGQSMSHSVDLTIPPDLPPTTGSAQHSLTYELRAEALSGFDQSVGSARRSLTVQCCRARTGGLPSMGTEPHTLVRTYKSDLLFGLIPVGSQVSCTVQLDLPNYGLMRGHMLGDRVTGQLSVAARKTYSEAHISWGTVVRGGGKTDKTELGGPVHIHLDESQQGHFAFNLPDRAAVTYNGVRVEYAWFMRVELADATGSNHKEEFAFSVFPRVQPQGPPVRRESLTRPKSSTTTPQGLGSGTLQGLTLGKSGGLTSSNLGGLKLGGSAPRGLSIQGGVHGLQMASHSQAAPEGLHQTPGGLHLSLEGLHVEPCDHNVEGITPAPTVAPTGGMLALGAAKARPPAKPPVVAAPKPPLVTPPPKPPETVQQAVAAQLNHEGGGVSPEVVQYLAKVVQGSPFFANLLPDDLAAALTSPDALKGHLTPELRQVLEQKLKQNPQIARVLPPQMVSQVAASKTAAEAEHVVGDAITETLLQKMYEQPRLGVALKYIVTNFPAFRKRLPAAVVNALPEGPGKVDLHAVKQLINEFPELKSHIPAGIQAMLGGGAPGKKK